ncbi:DUF4855 domain-containing protein [Neobacillus sp. D3-1R]|uniref:DUF4855 domain-containing protein n=1 Tax=Neobacillus sp. D3-1R TaxID=3445778 RepID=UPI003FA1789C
MNNLNISKYLKSGIISTLLVGLISSNALASDLKKPSDEIYTNLALSKPYTVVQEMHDKQLMAYETRTDGDNGNPYELTDGKIAESKVNNAYFFNPNWVGYSRQVARSVIIDLGSEKFINSIKGGFLQERSAAVDIPRYVNFYLSNDGEKWLIADELKPKTSKSHEAVREEIGVKDINVTARYVKVQFEVGMFSFIDEITVMGRDADKKDKDVITLKKVKKIKDEPLPSEKDTNGVKDMYLAFLYPDHTGNGPLGTWKKEDFKHVITHVDENGASTDWMFDSILFQNGGDPYRDYKDKNLWNQAINKLFTSDVNLDALEQSTAEVKQTLGDSQHKTKVVFSIPYPALQSDNWGELDGEQLNFRIDQPGGEKASFNARKAAVKWYIDEIVKKFKEKNYQHIEIAGFYWTHEEVGYGTLYEEDLVKEVSKMIHDQNAKFYWIPFFQANGSTIWKELGFDAIMMQPNYYFQTFFGPNADKGGEIDLSRMESAIKTAKRFGMGLEVEGDYHMLWNGWGTDYDGQVYHSDYAMRKYYAYLNEIKKAGLDQTIVGYYLGARTVIKQFIDDPIVKNTYDLTNDFIHDDYEIQELSNETIPPPTGDTWKKPTELEAKVGDVFTTPKAFSTDKWYKFPIKAGEDWVVTLTPIDGAFGMETRLWGENQTAHSGFSYNKETQTQSLVVSNPTSSDTYVMLRVYIKGTTPGNYRISLSKPIEDGTTMMNSIELQNGNTVVAVSNFVGQETWYRVSGKKAFSILAAPDANTDIDLELYWDTNSGSPIKTSSINPAGVEEKIEYSNPFAESFVFYVKVKSITTGEYSITFN